MDSTDNHARLLKCSVAVSPPDRVIEQVRQLKQKLRSNIGWYNSINALAHITFNVFQTNSETLTLWEAYMNHFAAQQSPVPLRFNRTGTFTGGAFFLAPDETSERILVEMMKAFHSDTPLPARQSVTPHISIGRRLTVYQLSVARKLIPEADIHFVCSDIVLRRFNEDLKQYDIYRRFNFEEIR